MNKKITATNALIFLIILVYLMDRYAIPIPDSYSGITNYVEDMPKGLAYLMGFCGGRLTDLFALCGTESRSGGGALYCHITVVLTHVSLLHLVINMIPLYFIGNFVERKLGGCHFTLIFFLTSFLESFITDPLYMRIEPSYAAEQLVSVNMGASGGVFGLMGAGLVLCLLNKSNWRYLKKSARIILAVYGVLTSYILGLGWSTVCHNVGFLLGILIMLGLYWLSPTVRGKTASRNTSRM